MEMKFVLRLAGAAGMMATMLMTGCTALNRDPCDPRPPRWMSEDYHESKAHLPVGARQKCKHGALWPPYARPTEEDQTFVHRYHASHYWPYPYNCWDQQSVYGMIDVSVDNGWVLQTTLYEYHFNEETSELNDAGLTHLRWILENAPQHHRVCWVQTGPNRQISELRLNSVQLAAAEMVGQENVPPVMLRVDSPTGRPAQYIDTQYRSFISSMPEPRITYQALPTGTGG
jgi:hypothetical protein